MSISESHTRCLSVFLGLENPAPAPAPIEPYRAAHWSNVRILLFTLCILGDEKTAATPHSTNSNWMSLCMTYLHFTLNIGHEVWLRWPDQYVPKAPKDFSLVFPLNTLLAYVTSLYLVPCPSWWWLSGYGVRVPTTPEVPGAPQRKLGTQACGAFLQESTSSPSLLPYKVLQRYDTPQQLTAADMLITAVTSVVKHTQKHRGRMALVS